MEGNTILHFRLQLLHVIVPLNYTVVLLFISLPEYETNLHSQSTNESAIIVYRAMCNLCCNT